MLQFITDSTTTEGTIKQALLALKGGCRWIQVRMKEAPDEEVEHAVKTLLPHCRDVGATLIVDDRVDIAAKCDADGVHLGKTDMDPTEAYKILGGKKIIGCTVNSIEDINKLPLEIVDYLGIGPYRFTTTKKRLSPILGLEGYRKITDHLKMISKIPTIAIGGITADDVIPIMNTGVSGIAVSGAINHSDNPVAATQQILKLLKSFKLIYEF